MGLGYRLRRNLRGMPEFIGEMLARGFEGAMEAMREVVARDDDYFYDRAGYYGHDYRRERARQRRRYRKEKRRWKRAMHGRHGYGRYGYGRHGPGMRYHHAFASPLPPPVYAPYMGPGSIPYAACGYPPPGSVHPASVMAGSLRRSASMSHLGSMRHPAYY